MVLSWSKRTRNHVKAPDPSVEHVPEPSGCIQPARKGYRARVVGGFEPNRPATAP